MKLLHTGDWHVGKLVRGRSRADEHRAVLAEIARIAMEEAVDVILVAGDLFETAAPPPEAEEIVYRALLDLSATGASVVVIAGNHDNPRRLRAVSPLLGLGRVHLVAEATPAAEGGLVEIDIGDEVARVFALPFVSQRSIVRADDLMSKTADELSPKYAERVRRVVDALCAGVGQRDDAVEVLCTHLFVGGAMAGGGERSAHLLHDYAVPSAAFPSALHYVALGHLHRAQTVPAGCPAGYAGSPLQLDFGEERDAKSVTVVEATPGTPAACRTVELTAGRRLRTIRGELGEIEARAGSTGDDHLRVVVTDGRRAGLADQVREWFPNAVDVVVESADDAPRRDRNRIDRSGAGPRELFEAYLADQDVEDPRILPAFDSLLEELS